MQVLDGLTPDDICEAVETVRSSRTLVERPAAVPRIVRRRRRSTVRVREEAGPHQAVSGRTAPGVDARSN